MENELECAIENNLSKEEILFLYLNHIYLADGTYGVEMASQNYFGKSAIEINIGEEGICRFEVESLNDLPNNVYVYFIDK